MLSSVAVTLRNSSSSYFTIPSASPPVLLITTEPLQQLHLRILFRMASKKSLSPPPPPWMRALNSPLPQPPKSTANIPDPPGFSTSKTTGKQRTQQHSAPKPVETDTLKVKKAWEIALAPSKQIPMNAIMMYMSGNSLQIFSIMMVFMLFKGPIQGLINTNATFAKLETDATKAKFVVVKLVYVMVQLLLLALGIFKVNAMGLLPYAVLTQFFFSLFIMLIDLGFYRTTRSDWLAWESERQPLERAYFAFG